MCLLCFCLVYLLRNLEKINQQWHDHIGPFWIFLMQLMSFMVTVNDPSQARIEVLMIAASYFLQRNCVSIFSIQLSYYLAGFLLVFILRFYEGKLAMFDFLLDLVSALCFLFTSYAGETDSRKEFLSNYQLQESHESYKEILNKFPNHISIYHEKGREGYESVYQNEMFRKMEGVGVQCKLDGREQEFEDFQYLIEDILMSNEDKTF